MRRANLISGVVLALFGLAMIFVVIPWQIEEGPDGMVSPRLVPTMTMVVITTLSVLLVITNLRVPAANADVIAVSPIARSEIVALLKIGALFALSVGLYLAVSPLAAGAVLVAGALLMLGERRPLIVLGMPATMLLALWFLFYRVLGTAIL